MQNRRNFFGSLITGVLGGTFIGNRAPSWLQRRRISSTENVPIVLSTWSHGIPANAEAWKTLSQGGRSIDAVELGVKVIEADPTNHSVGIGGMPDRDGNVTLDACIMDDRGNCGGVCFLQGFVHPISVARRVMDETPHVLLAGAGARKFALEQGFLSQNLLTSEARQAWEKWKVKSNYQPVINWENHDTIGMVAMDAEGNLSGACTTSGLAFKMQGRVGDSPIIGAGLYVDNEVGAAVCTGMGEEIIRTVGAFSIVELMRHGYSPEEACKEAIRRVVDKGRHKEIQIGYIALRKDGKVGAYGIHPGFNYALHDKKDNTLVDAPHYIG
ncbi:MAG: N(4)-(beta-N-acetylglucosaminyl)-L-asparaginase [Bacteroidota bacterium]